MIGTRIALGCAFAVLSATGVTAASGPTLGDLRAAFASREPPRLVWQGQIELTIAVANAPDRVDVTGRCRTGRPVVIAARSVAEPARADCNASRYAARLPTGSGGSEIVASQLMLDGTIIAARYLARRPAAAGRSSGPPICRRRSHRPRPAIASWSCPAGMMEYGSTSPSRREQRAHPS